MASYGNCVSPVRYLFQDQIRAIGHGSVFLRWSNANSDKKYRLQPFGGTLSDFREVKGYHLPFNVEAGNMIGTDDYFIFY